MRLSAQMSLATMGLLGTLMVGLAGTTARSVAAMSDEEARAGRLSAYRLVDRLSTTLSSHVALAVRAALRDHDHELVLNIAEATRREDPNIVFVRVLGDDGTVVADTLRSGNVGGADDRPDLVVRLRDGAVNEVVTLEEVPANPGVLRTLGIRIGIHGEPIGQLRLGYSTARVEAELARSLAAGLVRSRAGLRGMLFLAAGFLVAGVALALFQSRRLTGAVRQLSSQARRIASGDLASRVDLRSTDEVGVLTSTFNHMADRISELLEQARRQAEAENEIALARMLQETFLPPGELLRAGCLELAGHVRTATQCGGDLWAYATRPDGTTIVVIADVTGHGAPAALITAAALGALEGIHALSEQDSGFRPVTAVEMMQTLNQAVLSTGHRQGLLMTCHVSVFDPRSGTLEHASAGHTFPYFLRQGRTARKLEVLQAGGSLLGDCHEPGFAVFRRTVEPGDRIVWYTDGLYECTNAAGEMWGERSLREAIRTGADVAACDVAVLRDTLVCRFERFTGGQPLADDVTLVVGRYLGQLEAVASREATTQAVG